MATGHTHRCAVPGCKRHIRLSMLMCSDHWFQVPGDLQRSVYQTWNAYRSPNKTGEAETLSLRREYVLAIQKAVDYVEEKKEKAA